MAAPVIEAADCTVSGSNTASTSWAVTHPACSAGDLLIWNIAWDNSTDTTDVAEPAGPNSEVLSEINATPVASNGTEVRGKCWYTICTGAWSGGTLTFTPTATESWTATVIRVPAGEFDPADPIGNVLTRSSTTGTDTTVENPTGALAANDGTGTLIWFAFVDADPLGATNPTGWTILERQDLGAVAHGIAKRDTQTTNGETVAETTWAIAGDSWGGISYVVRGPPVYAVAGTVRFVGQTPTVETTNLGQNAWATGAWASGAWATGAWDVEASVSHAVTPGVGTFRLVGLTPTAGFTHSVAPSVGAVVVSGQQPSLSFTDNMAVAPSVGSLIFAGQQPSVGATFSVAPSVGTLLFGGQQPTVAYTDHVAVAPSVGTVRFAGAAPSVGFTHSVAPSVATFRFVGLQPTVTWGDNQAVQPSTGTLVFVGQTPTVENLSGYAWHPNAWASGAWAVGAWAPDQPGTTVSPSVGTLRFEGQTPTVETGEKSVAPQTGVLRFVGNAPPLGDTSALVDFDTPAKSLLIGADQQTFRVLVRKTVGTNPTVDIDLYEGGAWVADLVSGTAVTSTTGQIVSATWNASLLADISGAGVQAFIYGHSSADAQVEIGAVEWVAELEAVQTPTVGTLRFAGEGAFLHHGLQVAAESAESTGAPGDLTTTAGVTQPVTGVESVGAANTVTITHAGSTAVAGVESVGSAGEIAAATVTNVDLVGVEGTGQVNVPTVTGVGNVTPEGVAGAGAAGDVLAGTITNVDVAGVAATSVANVPTVTGFAQASVSGAAATGDAGTLSALAQTNVPLTGVEATGAPGDFTTTATGSAALTGAAATAAVGTLNVSAGEGAFLDSVESIASAGTVETFLGAATNPLYADGVAALCEVGEFTVAAAQRQRIRITAVSPARRAITARIDDRRKQVA